MRRWKDRLFFVVCALCAGLACALFAAMVGVLVAKGLPALDGSLLSRPSTGAGAEGGLRYQILGTLLLGATALALAVPLATAVALVESVYLAGRPRFQRWLRVGLYTANATPSVLLGIAGLVVFSRALGWGKSWLAGGILLGLMITPTVTVALSERIRSLPAAYRETAASLGLTRSQVVWSVLLRQSLGGLVSGCLLGLARAAGETAPILFAAAVFSGAELPAGIRDSPVVALPYHIFVLAQDSVDPAAETHLWAAAAVLVALVLAASLLAAPLRLKLHQEARHG